MKRLSFTAILTVIGLILLGCSAGEQEPASETTSIVLEDVGFQTPESVLFDEVANIYLVSNINGSPTEEDDNGFISRVTPGGEVENLKWIDGASPTSMHRRGWLSGEIPFMSQISTPSVISTA